MPYAFDNPTDVDADADTISWASVTRAAGFDAFAATPSSANFAALVTGETGSGAIVFGTSPTLSNPTLSGTVAGTPTFSGVITIAASGIPLTVNSTSSSTSKILLSDNGVTRGYVGADGTYSTYLFNAVGTVLSRWTHTSGLMEHLFDMTVTGDVRINGGQLYFGGTSAYLNYSATNQLDIVTADATRLRVDAAGLVTINNGITVAGGVATFSTTPVISGSGLKLSIVSTSASDPGVHITNSSARLDRILNTSGGMYFGVNTNGTERVMALNTDGGLTVGSPTGGSKGVGTINATAVYDDNTLLTCYIIEAWKYGAIDLAKWDALTPDLEHAAVYETVDTGETDADGNAITEQHVVTEAWTEQRQHTPARGFANVAAARLDIDNFSQFVFDNERLPAFPAPDRWQEMYEGKMATGDLIQRLWETVEVMAVHSIEARKRELALIARVEALEAAT